MDFSKMDKMSPNEFSLGNYVYFRNTLTEIRGVQQTDLLFDKFLSVGYVNSMEDIEYVPLNRVNLEKFGFVKMEEVFNCWAWIPTDNTTTSMMKGIHIYLHRDFLTERNYSNIYLLNGETSFMLPDTFLFAHQLQNIVKFLFNFDLKFINE